jgi:hypothetical protein
VLIGADQEQASTQQGKNKWTTKGDDENTFRDIYCLSCKRIPKTPGLYAFFLKMGTSIFVEILAWYQQSMRPAAKILSHILDPSRKNIKTIQL